MSNHDYESLQQQWDVWFADVSGQIKSTGFRRWKILSEQTDALRKILDLSEFDFHQSRNLLSRAERTLDFHRPYQIVLIGESGSGKSTLINSLMQQTILVTGSGGAVTGVATYVYPNATEPGKEYVRVVYRSSSDFQKLLDRIEQQRSTLERLGSVGRERIEHTIADIHASWTIVKQKGHEGQSQEYSLSREQSNLRLLMEENSTLNSDGSSERVIAGIKRIEYYLSDQSEGLSNCIVIDTPGLGARTLRHQEILRAEIESADAVILVVGARRPEQQTDETATLMRNILFAGYTSEQQTTFATKVFLVVNQYDAIKDDEDRRRLKGSIEAIAEVIAPDYWRKYGNDRSESKYFEMIATDLSRVEHLRNQLKDFLSRSRLELMLQEARVQNQQAIEHAKEACNLILRDVNYGRTKMSPRALEINLTNQVCLARLESDRQGLENAVRTIYANLRQYIISQEHQDCLIDIIQHIREAQREEIRQSAPKLLQNLDVTEVDDVTLGEVKDTAVNTLLLRTQHLVRRRLESEMETKFAKYYIDLFLNELQNLRLYSQIGAASYGQSYISDELQPVSEIESVQKRICDGYVAACRQVLIYELLQMPIIESLRNVDSKIWTIVNSATAFTPTDISLSEQSGGAQASTFEVKHQRQWLNSIGRFGRKMVIETIGVGQDEPEQAQDLTAEKMRDKILRSKLQEVMESSNRMQDIEQISELLISQFEQRTDSALKQSLPFLESAFFYELGGFRRRYNEVIEEIKENHMLHINDPNFTIRQVLLDKDSQKIQRLTRAAAVMAELESVRLESY